MNLSSPLNDFKALYSLWRGFALSFGAATLVIVCSLWLNRLWLPLLAYILAFMIYLRFRRFRSQGITLCYAVPILTVYALIMTGVVFTLLDIWHTPWLFKSNPGPHTPENASMPYIGALVVYPTMFVFLLWGTLRGHKMGFCIDCHQRFGTPTERGFIGQLFSQEGLFQRSTIATLTAILSAACWLYYLLRYVNVSFNRADIFAFIIMPVIVYVAALIGLGFRYLSIWYYYNRDIEGSVLRHGKSTTLRYIIISDNDIMLAVPNAESEIVIGEEKADTPVKLTIPYTRQITLADARYYLLNYLQLKPNSGIEVRLMYANNNATDSCNVFHYLVFVKNRGVLDNVNASWFSIMEIKNMLEKGECAKMLGIEITRLHTIAMAWKTYDRNGRRLYKIKHYIPTFRISDIHKWDVDYGDAHWLFISRNNEDKPFYRWRKFWRRYVNGVKD